MMKPTAMIINTSRGPVVDEAALARALRENWIAGAALDVYATEPLSADSPLRDPAIADRCRLLPHFASAARITRLSADPDKGMAGRCVQGLIDVLEGNYGGDITKMPFVVNKEAFGRSWACLLRRNIDLLWADQISVRNFGREFHALHARFFRWLGQKCQPILVQQ